MKWISLLSAILVTFTVVACEQSDTGAEVEGTVEEAVVPDQLRQMTIQSIDSRLSEFDQDIAMLEEQAQATETAAEVRDEIQDDVLEAREDIQEINTRRMELEQATAREAYNDTRADIWQEMREVDILLTDARLEAPENLESYRTVAQEEHQKFEQDVTELEGRAAGVDQAERAEFDEDLASLTERRSVLDSTMTQLETATETNWEDTRANINEALREAKTAYYNVLIPGGVTMGLDVPDIDAPDIDAPDLEAPDLDAPGVDANGSDTDTGAKPDQQQ